MPDQDPMPRAGYKSTDLSNTLLSDETGAWHLVRADHANYHITLGRKSVIVHKCPGWGLEEGSPLRPNIERWPFAYWTLPQHLQAPCRTCDVRPPEAIVNLFLLHNFDTFADDL